MRIGIAADHGGFELKEQITTKLQDSNFEIEDYGAHRLSPGDDYPDFVIPLAKDIALKKIERGIVICGSGIGACIAANKIKEVRAGTIHDGYSARQGVEDDNMNVICLGGRVIGWALAWHLVQIFLSAQFSGQERHKRRLAKVNAEETKS
jgi:ribose 5-phosphate isomerase B